jgi:4-amino-4-deoxy-L-arabinose transferase-like glycosyltransferase
VTDSPRSFEGWLPHLWQTVLFPAATPAPTRGHIGRLLLIALLPAVLLYPCRSFHLLEPDEGRYAQIPKELLDRGAWVVPTLQGEPYLDKPPLFYWLVKLSYQAFGVSEASARLVPAVCVHLTILAVYLLGRRSVGEKAAFWAALLLTVSPGYLGVARLLLLDGLLTLLVTLSVLCGYEAVRTGRLRWGWWLAAAVASGLGFLTKGPISEVLLFPPLLAIGWLGGTTARVGWRGCTAFATVVFAVNLPWYVAMYGQRPEFLGHFFWEHNVLRFVKPFDHLQPVWYYVPVLLGGFLPGVLVGVPYLRALLFRVPSSEFRVPSSPSGGFWLLSGLWCLAFFSASGSKLPTYILPAFPPLCLALGEFVARSRWDGSRFMRLMPATFATLLAGWHFVGLPWYAEQRSPLGRPERVLPYVSDPETPVVTYPRNVDSVAYYTGRNDLRRVRSTDVNTLIMESHFRPRTVVLFTHDHSLEAFRHALPPSLRVAEAVSVRDRKQRGLAAWLTGGGAWGLCDIAVLEPVPVARGTAP